MQWRGWINDGITKPPDGPPWRDIGCRVCSVAVPGGNGDWGGFRQLNRAVRRTRQRRGSQTSQTDPLRVTDKTGAIFYFGVK